MLCHGNEKKTEQDAIQPFIITYVGKSISQMISCVVIRYAA